MTNIIGTSTGLVVYMKSGIISKPEDILNAEVTHTIVDGRILFERK